MSSSPTAVLVVDPTSFCDDLLARLKAGVIAASAGAAEKKVCSAPLRGLAAGAPG